MKEQSPTVNEELPAPVGRLAVGGDFADAEARLHSIRDRLVLHEFEFQMVKELFALVQRPPEARFRDHQGLELLRRKRDG